ALLGPIPVINCVIGLHGRNYGELAKPGNVDGTQVLRVLNAESAITRSVLLSHLLEHSENGVVSAVADRMDRNLQSGAIRAENVFLHFAFGDHVLTRDSTVGGRVSVGFEE